MQTVAMAATHGENWNAPTRTRNSPTNPDSPGSPPEAKQKKPSATAHTGRLPASPPILAIVRS